MRLCPLDYYHPRALAETRDYPLGPLTTERLPDANEELKAGFNK